MSLVDSVGLAKQATVGTKVTVMEFFPPVESFEIEPQRDTIEVEETTGSRYPTGIEYGVQYWKGSVKFAPRLISFPRWLSMWFGLPEMVSTAAPTAKQHKFPHTSNPDLIPKVHSLFVNRKDMSPNIIDLFYDCYGDELELSIEPNGVLEASGTILMLQLDPDQTLPSVTLDSSRRVTFDQVVANVSVNGGAEAPLTVRSLNCKYANEMDDEAGKVLGSKKLSGTKEGNASEELTLEIADNTVFKDWYRRNQLASPDKVKVRVVATGPVIQSAVAWTWEHTIYDAEVIEAPVNIDAGERVTSVPIKLRCAYSTSDSKFIEHSVTNTQVTAY